MAQPGSRVAIFGAGISGLTVAHLLHPATTPRCSRPALQVALSEVVRPVAEPVVPGPRQLSATAPGNLIVSSLLKSFVLVPSAAVVCESWPNQIDPSDTASWTTIPDPSLSTSEMSRSVRRWSLATSNWPRATAAKFVYSPSVAKIHG